MIASSRRRGGRVLLIVCAVLFGLFAGLVVYQKHYADRERLRTDPDLGAELAIVALIEEGPPLEGDWPQWRGPRRRVGVPVAGARNNISRDSWRGSCSRWSD
jgi:hypothetical protein